MSVDRSQVTANGEDLAYVTVELAAFHGRAVAAVRAGTEAGPIIVEVETDELPTRQVRIDAVSGRNP